MNWWRWDYHVVWCQSNKLMSIEQIVDVIICYNQL